MSMKGKRGCLLTYWRDFSSGSRGLVYIVVNLNLLNIQVMRCSKFWVFL